METSRKTSLKMERIFFSPFGFLRNRGKLPLSLSTGRVRVGVILRGPGRAESGALTGAQAGAGPAPSPLGAPQYLPGCCCRRLRARCLGGPGARRAPLLPAATATSGCGAATGTGGRARGGPMGSGGGEAAADGVKRSAAARRRRKRRRASAGEADRGLAPAPMC